MNQVKDTARATVRLGYDGRVHKTFRGPHAEERFRHEVRVLQYLEQRACPFVPRLLLSDPDKLLMVTTNCGSRVEHMDDTRVAALFAELEAYGVRHEDRYLRNITYNAQLGRFCLIDFEFATLLDDLPVKNETAALANLDATESPPDKPQENNALQPDGASNLTIGAGAGSSSIITGHR